MVLVLKLVHCTKISRLGVKYKYGPYGPYYYEYWWDSIKSKTRCRYVGIQAPKPRLPPRINPEWWNYTTWERIDLAIQLIKKHCNFTARWRGYGLRHGDCSDVKPWVTAVCNENAAIRVLRLGDPERQGSQNATKCCFSLQRSKPETGERGIRYVSGPAFKLPVFIVGTSEMHYICAIQLEEDPEELGDWLFFQYDNPNIQVGDWQLPHGCHIYIDDVYSVGCYGWMGDLVADFHVP